MAWHCEKMYGCCPPAVCGGASHCRAEAVGEVLRAAEEHPQGEGKGEEAPEVKNQKEKHQKGKQQNGSTTSTRSRGPEAPEEKHEKHQEERTRSESSRR